ncbi:hypothetical protein [Elstera litoralis]|uniref:hypothetical protein n=1 Tax=Elstera litoralis TaxID=552518 RepID=UPI001E5F76DE|nr:hypothetical protein [Elstera litoralis]
MLTAVKAAAKPKRPTNSQSWTQDPEGVKREILAVARAEFVEKGLSGARSMKSPPALRPQSV